MAAPVNLDALANVLQALTAVLQTFQSNIPEAPAAAAPADHVKILGTFGSVNHFELGSRDGSYDFAKASAPLDETWDVTIEKFPSFFISLRFHASKVRWNAPAPQGILDIYGSKLLTDYHSLNTLQVYNTSTSHVYPRAIQNASAMYSCLKFSISGDLKSTLFSQAGNLPTHEYGACLFVHITTFTMAVSLQLSIDSFKRILDFDPANHGFNITSINTKLNHLFVLATTGQRTIGEPESIQHNLTAYACINQPEEWAQWVRLQIDRFEEGMIPNSQSFMNTASVKYVKISANSSGSFRGSITTIRIDTVSMMAAVSKKRTPPPYFQEDDGYRQ